MQSRARILMEANIHRQKGDSPPLTVAGSNASSRCCVNLRTRTADFESMLHHFYFRLTVVSSRKSISFLARLLR